VPVGGELSPRANPRDRLGHRVLRVTPRQPREHLGDRLPSGLPQWLGIGGLVGTEATNRQARSTVSDCPKRQTCGDGLHDRFESPIPACPAPPGSVGDWLCRTVT
jgi:hypothetical protein